MRSDVINDASPASPRPNAGNRTSGRTPGLVATVGYVARHGWMLFCLIGVLATYIAVMLNRGAPWRGDIIWTVDWITIGFVLSGPLIAGCVAVDTARFSVGVRDLPLRRWRNYDSAVAIAYGLALASLHMLFVVAIIVISAPPRLDPATALAVLAQVMIVFFFVAVGVLVGRFAPLVLGGIGAALAALVSVYMFTAPRSDTGLLYSGAATVPRIGYAYSVLWLSVQIIVVAIVIVAMWIVRPGWGRSRTRLALLTMVALVLTFGALRLFAAVPGERLDATDAKPDACAALAGVPYCYYREHDRVIYGYASLMLALFEASEAKGYGGLVPDRVEEAGQTTWPSGAHVGVFYVTPEVLGGEEPTLWEVTLNLVQPVHCKQLQGDLPPSQQYWDDLFALTATWVMLVDPQAGESVGYFDEPLSPDVAQRIMTEFRTCSYAFG